MALCEGLDGRGQYELARTRQVADGDGFRLRVFDCCTLSMAASYSTTMPFASSAKASPALVRLIPCWLRTMSWVPRACSKLAMCLLRTGCVTENSRAVCVKLSVCVRRTYSLMCWTRTNPPLNHPRNPRRYCSAIFCHVLKRGRFLGGGGAFPNWRFLRGIA